MVTQPQIMQFSFVVDDLDSAIEHWATKMQIGPFFVVEHVLYRECCFRDKPTDIDMSVAIAYQGQLQIELVKQHNNAPSIFSEFADSHGSGLQHVAAVSDDLTGDIKDYAERGFEPIQQGQADNGTLFAYLDVPNNPVPGTMLELVQLPHEVKSAFDYMQRAALEWNPAIDPIRR